MTQPIELRELLERLRGCRGRTAAEKSRDFDVYAFADYCGAARDGKIVLAVSIGAGDPSIIRGVRTRGALLAAFRETLAAASASHLRAMIGQDHQYGIPAALAAELGLAGRGWREAMRSLFVTGPDAPLAQAGRAGAFAAAINARLQARGDPPYFWSATKDYGIPRRPPRPREDPTVRRLTEVDVACAFDRVGDNGTVGGQTIVGMPRLLELVDGCGSSLRVWPFDGLHLGDFEQAHVMIEPYPSLVRERGIAQTDANDAIACVIWAQTLDGRGELRRALDLRGLPPDDLRRASFEGWIAGIQKRAGDGQAQ